MLQRLQIEPIVRAALAEDIRSGDITTEATVPASLRARAEIVAKQEGVIAGLEVAALAFALLDPELRFDALAEDGDSVTPGQRVVSIEGRARAILMGERVALNFLQRLSGIATLTRRFVDLVAGTGATIVDTRKTTPGLRLLEKYAVRAGGGQNHRYALDDAILIKDNHIAAAGGITEAVRRARARGGHTVVIEVETQSREQVEEALAAGAGIIMFDNMTPDQMRDCVALVGGRALTEASGGINEATARAVAETGVDLISVGALTHSAPALDLSLKICTAA
ncbi:MAG TPA: carboxylating nicotinate-nucleotide diphosphorylase [Armatimonadota bacterium]|nr:carboxylating nicotinate-nucleotide diphosphorylase [Armatimonadota bacterium]HOJ20873.1 carboxylating nicotinate-nucleotide diphosphorylase [Armatimonadota bacterium]HOM80366.1 carboxylating nicotinate-nucleotide diphosphorylase [Armatimonadota bacterium]HOQ27466.1 carboxylating nicotinate-nucleotide diphosphorylase [Armatimonadota bacterium]HPO72485.1 carboxylating nicotinate-nucleotide diphosphorylase [Armatimonadota bacterium]